MTVEKNIEHFLVWLTSNQSKQKSPTAEIIGMNFIRTILPIKYMPIISAIGGSLVWINLKTTKQEIVHILS